ncbi:MAG: NAD-dependent epimerase, partial [Bacteroidota bacterium]
IRSSYNLAGISFSPGQISQEIQRHIPHFSTVYAPDFRQEIAESWPRSVDDTLSQQDWNWKAAYDLEKMTKDMLTNLAERLKNTEN